MRVEGMAVELHRGQQGQMLVTVATSFASIIGIDTITVIARAEAKIVGFMVT